MIELSTDPILGSTAIIVPVNMNGIADTETMRSLIKEDRALLDFYRATCRTRSLRPGCPVYYLSKAGREIFLLPDRRDPDAPAQEKDLHKALDTLTRRPSLPSPCSFEMPAPGVEIDDVVTMLDLYLGLRAERFLIHPREPKDLPRLEAAFDRPSLEAL